MKASELRKKYIEFFKKKGHAEIPSASLIPENDPTVLFTTAGMHPLIPYLLGEKHSAGNRLVNVQKCLRTGDIDEVGDACHLTFFEMLGNWSLGDPNAPDGVGAGYFKREAIEWSFEFLASPPTGDLPKGEKKWLGIKKEMLAVSVFGGDKDAPRDEESASIWLSFGLPKERIVYLGKEDNWWGPAGETGPCGPDSEMFFWTGGGKPPREFDPENKLWVEIWNDVFMQYNKTKDGRYEPLKQKNVDTGMGLERTLAALNGKATVYETELFEPIIRKIEELSKKKYGDSAEITRSMRIIADHLRAATFILGDEKAIMPSNKDRGYVLRRLIRRSVRYGYGLGIREIFTFKVAEAVTKSLDGAYPELKENKDFIINQLIEEEEKFKKTLEYGLKQFQKYEKITGKEAFDLFQTYGFPFELTKELAREKGMIINEKEFQEEFKRHQELSRTASAGMFKGGLADASEISKKYHTATHLLLASLRKVLGGHVFQKGSNINPERLRFDFSHEGKMTAEQIKRVEDLVNEQIKKDLPVKMEEMSLEEAKQRGATGVFEAKYGEKVRVYSIGDFSREICGGPHVKSTGELGHFKIIKEEAVSAGTRRIKAVLE
jgi:alanyl-tRNA synthetase